jgi:hypothetical protein
MERLQLINYTWPDASLAKFKQSGGLVLGWRRRRRCAWTAAVALRVDGQGGTVSGQRRRRCAWTADPFPRRRGVRMVSMQRLSPGQYSVTLPYVGVAPSFLCSVDYIPPWFLRLFPCVPFLVSGQSSQNRELCVVPRSLLS